MNSKLFAIAATVGAALAASGSASANSKNSAIGPMYQGTGKVSSIHPEPVKPSVQWFKGKGKIDGWKGLKGATGQFGTAPRGFKGFKH